MIYKWNDKVTGDFIFGSLIWFLVFWFYILTKNIVIRIFSFLMTMPKTINPKSKYKSISLRAMRTRLYEYSVCWKFYKTLLITLRVCILALLKEARGKSLGTNMRSSHWVFFCKIIAPEPDVQKRQTPDL